ncbi:Imm32 family immunity protein [Spirillospora sp. CA-255316]
MEQLIVIPDYQPSEGLRLSWDEGFEIEVSVARSEVIIKGNRAGLTSLARHLLTLAQEGVRDGMHVHLTADQEIESEIDLILERMMG